MATSPRYSCLSSASAGAILLSLRSASAELYWPELIRARSCCSAAMPAGPARHDCPADAQPWRASAAASVSVGMVGIRTWTMKAEGAYGICFCRITIRCCAIAIASAILALASPWARMRSMSMERRKRW